MGGCLISENRTHENFAIPPEQYVAGEGACWKRNSFHFPFCPLGISNGIALSIMSMNVLDNKESSTLDKALPVWKIYLNQMMTSGLDRVLPLGDWIGIKNKLSLNADLQNATWRWQWALPVTANNAFLICWYDLSLECSNKSKDINYFPVFSPFWSSPDRQTDRKWWIRANRATCTLGLNKRKCGQHNMISVQIARSLVLDNIIFSRVTKATYESLMR